MPASVGGDGVTRAARFARFAKRPTRKEHLAQAVLFLCRARSIDSVTAEWLAHRYSLTLVKATTLLEAALKARGAANG